MNVLHYILNASGLVREAFAQATTPPPGDGGGDGSGLSVAIPNPIGCPNFTCVASNIIDVLFIFVGPITVIMILVGGFQILTAHGDPDKVKKGRNTILYAFVGFGIVAIGKGWIFIIVEILS